MCHDDPFKDEQCMKKETLGSNDFVWVRKCKGAKVCVQLPYYNKIIGASSIKVRPHYDGESCANGNKCGSGICDGTKCKGLNPDVECVPGLGQCQKGYLCRANTNSVNTCQKPIANNGACSGYETYDDEYKYDPAVNVCKLNHICSVVNTTAAKCIEIGSQTDNTKVSNPMACSSGVGNKGTELVDGEDVTFYTCITPTASTTEITGINAKTSRGATFTNFANMTKMFTDWKKEAKDNSMKDEDAIYEAYRYTRNKKKINKLFFQYSYAPKVEDADECAFDYWWKQNSSNSLKFSLMILVLALLF
jgi:hypothetical protein